MKKIMLANPIESSGGGKAIQSHLRMRQGWSFLPTMSPPRATPYWPLEDAGCLGMGAWSWVRQPSSAEGMFWQHPLHLRVLLCWGAAPNRMLHETTHFGKPIRNWNLEINKSLVGNHGVSYHIYALRVSNSKQWYCMSLPSLATCRNA